MVLSVEVRRKLFSPWVLRAAWRKVLTWYQSGEWYDPAELQAWKADPWWHLSELADSLVRGEYRPDPFPLVPYPKKEDVIRHYCMPSVRDQVAFMVFLVLLGPFLEAVMSKASFGNRLYRPRVLVEPHPSHGYKRWYRAPFSLGHSRIYESFARSYGLFRRMSQWLINLHVFGKAESVASARSAVSTSTGDGVAEFDLEDPDTLPYHEALRSAQPQTDLVYARLDLSLAYPSVDRRALREVLRILLDAWPGHDKVQDQLARSENPFRRWFEKPRPLAGEHPWDILDRSPEARLHVGEMLMDAFESVRYAPWEEPPSWRSVAQRVDSLPFEFRDRWNGSEVAGHLTPERGTLLEEALAPKGIWPMGCHLNHELIADGAFGLPTGLAISGFLLNIALTPLDKELERQCEELGSLYYLRYVDDIVVIATDATHLQGALETIHAMVAHNGRLPGRFQLNSGKAKPEPVKTFLSKLDEAVANGEGKGRPRPVLRFLRKHYLTRSNAEIFTTGIVRELSELADEAFDERFGAAGLDRLDQLIALAVNNIDDIEVAKDARLSFAVNHIARSSWDQHVSSLDGENPLVKERVEYLLTIAEQAVCQHPWRAKLWRPILIMAARASTKKYGRLGRQWLKDHILPLLKWDDGQVGPSVARTPWERYEPSLDSEPPPDGLNELLESLGLPPDTVDYVHQRRSHYSRLRASYHRAHFWRQWVGIVLALRERVTTGRGQGGLGAWTSLLSDTEATEILDWLGGIDGFIALASVLYGFEESKSAEKLNEPVIWWWEAEAICWAVLSASDPSVEFLTHLGAPRPRILRKPSQALVTALMEEVVRREPRLQRLSRAMRGVLGYKDLSVGAAVGANCALLWLVNSWLRNGEAIGLWSRDNSLSKLLPADDQPFEWAALARLGLLEILEAATMREDVPPYLLSTWLPPITANTGEPNETVWRRLRRLDAYHSLRRHALAIGRIPRWCEARSWFETVVPTSATTETRDRVGLLTLFKALFKLSDAATPMAPAHVPALETDAYVAFAVGKALESRSRGFPTPDTVVLHAKVSTALNTLRRELLNTDDRVYTPDYRTVAAAYDVLIKHVTAHVSNGRLLKDVLPLTDDTVAPHALFLLPELIRDNVADGESRMLANRWRAALITLWLADGAEHELDTLYESAPWHSPLSDRNLLRAKLLFDEEAWKFIETALGSIDAKAQPFQLDAGEYEGGGTMEPSSRRLVDIRFSNKANGWYRMSLASSALFDVEPGSVHDTLNVRLLQGKQTPRWNEWFSSSRERLATGGRIFLPTAWEVADFLHEIRTHIRQIEGEKAQEAARVHLAVMPECYMPRGYLSSLRQFVRETGVALLVGLLFRELPRSVHIAPSEVCKGIRCVVNEAVLILPSPDHWRGRPVTEYVFSIRKPFASATEAGLVRFLAEKAAEEDSSAGSTWSFVPGTHWYRFQFPQWGYFSVAICSDLLDTFIWNWLRGRIQHLFVLAWNRDIDLFDQLSWTRSYELYANVVNVNHGTFGGSIAWTPKSGHDKLLFRTHGRNLALAVTVALPLRELVNAQRHQFDNSVDNEVEEWRAKARPQEGQAVEEVAASSEGNRANRARRSTFKTPSPGYPRFRPRERQDQTSP